MTIAGTKNRYARRAYIMVWSAVMVLLMIIAIPAFFVAGIIDGLIDAFERWCDRFRDAPEMFRGAWGLW
jgi:hypothetical protein